MNLQACDHESIQNCEQLSTQVNVPLISQSPQHLSTILKTFERTNVQIQDHFSLQAYRHFIIQMCSHVCGYQTCEHTITKHLNIGAGNHQSVQAYEHEGI